MKEIKIQDLKSYKDFWIIEDGNIKVVFSNAKENNSFNRSTESGISNLQSLKNDFNVDEVVYLKQIHSDIVHVYSSNEIEFIENEGDAIVTDKENVIIGAFTADCVPIILVDTDGKAISAIHSGWKGTYNSIVKKALEKMESDFSVKPSSVKAYIGPHIRQCCYEVSEELKEKFIKKINVPTDKLFDGRNLSMEACIEHDLLECGVIAENINSISLCTHCETEEKLFSYRKSNGDYGRLFSFIFIDNRGN